MPIGISFSSLFISTDIFAGQSQLLVPVKPAVRTSKTVTYQSPHPTLQGFLLSKKPLLAAVVLAILAILLVIPADDTYTDEGDDDPQYRVLEKAEPRYPDLGTSLNRMVASVEAGQAVEKVTDNGAVHNAGMVAVSIYLSGETDGVVSFLEDNGGSPRNVGEDYIEAYVPVPLLGQVSEQPGVLRVREIMPAPASGPPRRRGTAKISKSLFRTRPN